MAKKKNLKSKGKLQLSKYFQKIDEGDYVAVVKESKIQSCIPDRIQGRTGIVEGKRGCSHLVKIKDQNKEKTYLIEPVHLKKIKISQKIK